MMPVGIRVVWYRCEVSTWAPEKPTKALRGAVTVSDFRTTLKVHKSQSAE